MTVWLAKEMITTMPALATLFHSPHPCEEDTTEYLLLTPPRYVRRKGHTERILSRLTTTRQYPHQPFLFSTSEALREGKCSHKNMDTHCVHVAISGKRSPFANLGCCCLPSPMHSRDICSPLRNSARRTSVPYSCSLHHCLSGSCKSKHMFPVVCIKPSYFLSAPQDRHSFEFSVNSKPLFKQREVAHI